MSDDLLLTLLWLLPLVGAVIVLFIPKRAGVGDQVGRARRSRSRRFVLTLIACGIYVGDDSSASAPLARARPRTTLLEPDDGTETLAIADESQTATDDLVVRRAWIPYFNIQYYLGLDGISLSLVLLTGLVSVLACLASWNIEKQVKGYFALFLLLMASMMGVFLVARPVPLLRLLRGDAPADVLPDRHLGRREPGVRGDQVPALHAVRLGLHPGRDPDPLLLAGRRRRDRRAAADVHGATRSTSSS